MAAELYKKLEKVPSYRGDDKDLRHIIDVLKRNNELLKQELGRLQKEKADV